MNGNLWRARLLAAFGVTACVLLGACGGGDDKAAAPTPTPKFSSSTGAAQSSSPTPTESSSGVPGETPEAFVRRWNELSTSMQNSGEATEYLQVSQGCNACTSTAKQVSGYFSAGGRVHTTSWKFRKLECAISESVNAQCRAVVVFGATDYQEEAGAPLHHLNAGKFKVIFTLNQPADGSWNLANLEQEPL